MNITIDYPMWAVASVVVFAIAWLVQVVLQIMVWQRPMRHSLQLGNYPLPTSQDASQPGVSILVYSHNEAESLARNLPVLLSQNYPNYEVIVLDDNSRDGTQDVLTMMDQRSDRFFHSRIDEKARAMSHRKLAVLLGTKAAHYDLILMTHAECLPSSADWVGNMVRHFANPAVEIVLGPVVYERRSNFLSRFCEFDLLQRLLMMLGITLSVKPFAGWGQNLAFRKSTFYANRSQGFQRHLKIQPGEDDLFVADVAREGNVAVEFQSASVVSDQSKPLFLSWSMERLNRGFTSRLYSWNSAIVKLVDYLTRYLTVVPGWALIVYTLYNVLLAEGVHKMSLVVLLAVLIALLVRAGLMIYTFWGSAKVLKQRPMLGWPVLLELYMPLVDLWFRVKALIHKKRFSVSKVGLM